MHLQIAPIESPIRWTVTESPSEMFKQFGIFEGYASQALKLRAILASLEASIMRVCVQNRGFSCWLLRSQVPLSDNFCNVFSKILCTLHYEKHIGNSFHIKETIFTPYNISGPFQHETSTRNFILYTGKLGFLKFSIFSESKPLLKYEKWPLHVPARASHFNVPFPPM